MTGSEIQIAYYNKTSELYDNMHLESDTEHDIALHVLSGLIELNNINRILDVGAGTGRVAHFLKNKKSQLSVVSIEPVKELREQGHLKGLSKKELIEGNLYKLDFPDNSFDLVTAFGVFHHLENPKEALLEMARVSSKYLFISDSNNFGQGNSLNRLIKHLLRNLKIWKPYIFITTKGKMYKISEGDGLAYSFSVFDIIKFLKKDFSLYFYSTTPSQPNLLRTAKHIALFSEKVS